ncbi:MAG: tetratricopeptide (TPR) repeat protein [Mariniblastus sp.]|jgi:tetratricopeptide (TPR) repeat protein
MNLPNFAENQSTFAASSRSSLNAYAVLIASALICVCQTGCNLNAQRHNTIGRQAFEQGQFSTAINEFQKALSVNPQSADAFYNLGASFYAMGKQSKNEQWLKQAEQLYRQAIAANDQHVDAHRGLASLLIETNQEQYAFDLLKTWQQRYPMSTEPIVELARLYQEYGDNRRATDLLADALKIDSNSVRALKAMGHVREVQGETHLALDNYMRVLQVAGQDPMVASKVVSLQTQLAQLPAQNGTPQPTLPASRYGAANPYLSR